MRVPLIQIVVCLGLCGIIDASLPSCSMADQQEERAVGWQYATVSTYITFSEPLYISFYADGRTLKVRSWADLLSDLVPQHLLVYGVSSKVDQRKAQGAVLDHLGRQGWELAGLTTRSMANDEGETQGKSEQWVFKRRR